MLACAQLAGVKQIITSKLFLERAKLNIQPMRDAGIEFIYLEDVRAGITRRRRWLRAGVACHCSARESDRRVRNKREAAAAGSLHQRLGRAAQGSGTDPRQLLANIRQMLAVLDLTDADRLFNSLPLFHSFGVHRHCSCRWSAAATFFSILRRCITASFRR